MAVHLFKVVSLLLFAAPLLFPSIYAKKIQYCDRKSDYDVKVSGVEISPYPVVRSTPTTFSLSASTDKAITGGKLQIDVSYFGFYIHSESHNLCEETSCPISTGDFVISHTQTLPGITPPGKYTLKMKLLGGNGNQMTCITFDFSIGFGSPISES
ncbi:uncharacterized protein LOC131248784 [Magnolia sinica]|uniref:uncharacterized protein LOC131248784 n=1 Tax=Magnolia sinica TaxID=86752 RepID=UPI0026596BAC|nr:uncharacterized protein LOC131248784 [Magnolia sinica]